MQKRSSLSNDRVKDAEPKKKNSISCQVQRQLIIACDQRFNIDRLEGAVGLGGWFCMYLSIVAFDM